MNRFIIWLFTLLSANVWVLGAPVWIPDSGPHSPRKTISLHVLFPADLLGEVFEPGHSSGTCPGVHLDNEEPQTLPLPPPSLGRARVSLST